LVKKSAKTGLQEQRRLDLKQNESSKKSGNEMTWRLTEVLSSIRGVIEIDSLSSELKSEGLGNSLVKSFLEL
jgi:uncharacterized protein YijF (DUF1287 family)